MNLAKQKILVTGVSSFVGCHLARGFSQKSEWEVLPTGSKNPEDYKKHRARRIKFGGLKNDWSVLNLKDEPSIKQFIRKSQPDIWIHHAGYATSYASLDYDTREGHLVALKAALPLFLLVNVEVLSVVQKAPLIL